MRDALLFLRLFVRCLQKSVLGAVFPHGIIVFTALGNAIGDKKEPPRFAVELRRLIVLWKWLAYFTSTFSFPMMYTPFLRPLVAFSALTFFFTSTPSVV